MSSSTEKETPKSSQFQTNLEVLRQVPFFAGLALEPLKVLAYLATMERFREGDYLFKRDETDGQAFCILQGEADLIGVIEEDEVVLRRIGEDEFMGGLALLGDMRRVFSLRAATELHCLVLTREKFVKTCEQFPQIMPKVLEVVVGEIRIWEDRFFMRHADACRPFLSSFGVSLV
jgi:CRP-like cAMP-binding protein